MLSFTFKRPYVALSFSVFNTTCQIPPMIFGALNCRPVLGKRVVNAFSFACRLATYRAALSVGSVPHSL